MNTDTELPRTAVANGSVPVATAGTEHCFDAFQCHFFSSVGKTLRIAGTATLGLGVLEILATVLLAVLDNEVGLLLFATPSALAFAAGAWTRRGGSSLQEMALRPETQIPCLVSAATDIQKVFRLQAIVLILGMVFVIASALFLVATSNHGFLT